MLSDDYSKVPVDEIRNLVSVFTMVGGRIVQGDDELASLRHLYSRHAGLPVNHFEGHFKPAAIASAMHRLA